MGNAALDMGHHQDAVMIGEIDARLRAWSEWCEHGGVVVGLGYGTNPIGSAVENGGQIIRGTGPASQPGGYDPHYEIDRAVSQLPSDMQQVVVEHYRHADAAEWKRVRRCGCSRRTYYRRLARAHQAILFLLEAPRSRWRASTGALDRARKRFKKNI